MRHGSLFSGIGGFDLAAEWSGWENVFHCEWNEFGRKVLNYYWPKSISYEDITKTDFTIWRGKIDVLTGGFPCQPYSVAGNRLGKEDDRHLWPEMLRAIQEIAPTYVVGENVYGLVNWNGGMVFEEVQADLEAAGYEVQPILLPAAGVNAPHRRDRVWFVAYSNGSKSRNDKRANGRKAKEVWWENKGNVSSELCSNGDASNSDNPRTDKRMRDNGNREAENEGRKGQPQSKFGKVGDNAANSKSKSSRGEHKQQQKQGEFRRFNSRNELIGFENFPTKSPICGRNDGFSDRLDGITFPKWRSESIKAYGNAIVPQVAYEIFKVINQMHHETN